MAETGLQRFGLAGLARATQNSLDWRNWGKGTKGREAERPGLSRDALDTLIEAEIIPRLMLTNRSAAEAVHPPALDAPVSQSLDAVDIDGFARRCVDADCEALVEEVERLLSAGISHEDVLLKLLAPAARRLGAWWDQDLRDFTEVTIGLMKLHRLLERINADGPCTAGAGGNAPRIYLAPAPGEQHVFGVRMVGEFFARAGWRVRCGLDCDTGDVLDAVSQEHFDVVGFSASAKASVEPLRRLIRPVRAASLNPNVAIMVGGQIFIEDVGLARRIGADATATDAVRAVVTAERMVHRLSGSSRSAIQQ